MVFAMTVVLFVTMAASAQTIYVRGNAPFGFIVNGTTLPAGECSVDSVGDERRVIFVRRSELADQELGHL
jgi:hypothetical protein